MSCMKKRLFCSCLVFCICLYVINLIKHVDVSLFKEDFELFWYIVGMDLWFSFENTVLYFLSGIIVMELLFTKIKKLFYAIPFLSYSLPFFCNWSEDLSLYWKACDVWSILVILCECLFPVIIAIILCYRKYLKLNRLSVEKC